MMTVHSPRTHYIVYTTNGPETIAHFVRRSSAEEVNDPLKRCVIVLRHGTSASIDVLTKATPCVSGTRLRPGEPLSIWV